jgi:glycosyltransferase involved in cell wall biosynthesis
MYKTVPQPTINDYLSKPADSLRKTGGRAASKNELNLFAPLVTVFTMVLNAKDDLLETIQSVSKQNYTNIEYIIIDGASTDGTLELIEKYSDKINLWISEPDQGTADAINKAISLATGKFIFCLPAGDRIEPNYIATAVNILSDSNAAFVFGRVSYYKDGIVDYVVNGDENYVFKWPYSPRLNHATWVIRRKCYEKFGLMDLNFDINCDYEWGLRLLRNNERGVYVSKLSIDYQGGGKSEKNDIRAKIQALRILQLHGVTLVSALTAVAYLILRSCLRRLASLLLPNNLYDRLLRLIRFKYIN